MTKRVYWILFGFLLTLATGAYGLFVGGELKSALFEKLSSDPTGTEARVYYNTTTKAPKIYNGTSWTSLGGGGAGEINYIDQGDGESGVGDWASYKDAASATPADGDGGTATLAAVTTTSTAANVLRENNSIVLEKSAAANEQGEGWSYDFTIDKADENKLLKVYFDYKFSTTNYDADSSGELLTVYIYDVTNTTLITPNNTDIKAGTSDGQYFEASWLATTSNSYRLIFHVEGTGTDTWSMYMDNLIVGPGRTKTGAVVSSWQTYTPSTTISSSWSGAPDIEEYEYRRVGEMMEVRGYIKLGSGGNPTGAPATTTFSLPDNFTFDTNYASINDREVQLGFGQIHDDGARPYQLAVTVSTTTTLELKTYFDYSSGTNPVSQNTLDVDSFLGSGAADDTISFFASVPVSQWVGGGTMNVLQEDNLTEWQTSDISITNFSATDEILRWRRVGSEMEVYYNGTSTGSAGGVIYITIPSKYTVNDGDLTGSNGIDWLEGEAVARDNGTDANTEVGKPNWNAGSSRIEIRSIQGSLATWAASDPFTWASNDGLHITARLPINEWANVNQNSLVGYSQATANNVGLTYLIQYDEGANTGLTGGVEGDANVSISLEPGTYFAEGGGVLRYNWASAPTYSGGYLKITDSSNSALVTMNDVGLVRRDVNSHRTSAKIGGEFTLSSADTVKLRAYVDASGGSAAASQPYVVATAWLKVTRVD